MDKNIIVQVVLLIAVVSIVVYIGVRDTRERFTVDDVQTNTLNTKTFNINDYNAIWPIGSVYLSLSSSVDPNKMFKGTSWTLMSENKYVRTSSKNNVGKTGGSNTHSHSISGHTLTTDEIPSHHHHESVVPWRGSRGGRADNSNSNGEMSPRNVWSWSGKVLGGDASWFITSNCGGNRSHNHSASTVTLEPEYVNVMMWKRVS